MTNEISRAPARTNAFYVMALVAVIAGGCERPPVAHPPIANPVPVATTEPGRDPLIAAIVFNAKPDLALSLIEAGADCNVVNSANPSPALYYAVAKTSCWLDVVRALIKHGAQVNARGKGGFTPLHNACYFESCPEIVEYLIAHGADISARERSGSTPLHVIAYCHFFGNGSEILKILIAHGADVNAIDSMGETPLDFAVQQKWFDGATLLRIHGAKSGKDNSLKQNPR